jgi:hypothetical protein
MKLVQIILKKKACPEGFKVAAPPLDLTSDRLETCPGDHTYFFQVS